MRASWARSSTRPRSDAEIGELVDRGARQCPRLLELPGALDHGVDEPGDGQRRQAALAGISIDLDRPLQVPPCLGTVASVGGSPTRSDQQTRLVRGVGGQLQRALEQALGLLGRAQRQRALGRTLQGAPRLHGEGIGLGARPRVAVGRLILGSQGTGQLVRIEPLEVARGGQVTLAAVVARQGLVGDLAQQLLGKGELPALGRAGVRAQAQHLATNESPQPLIEPFRGAASHGCERFGGEGLPQHRCALEQPAVVRVERVQPRGDQGAQALGRLQRSQVRGRLVGPVELHQPAVVEQHAHRLHRIERDAPGAIHDPIACGGREPRHQAGQQRIHRVAAERGQWNSGGDVAGAPLRVCLEQLRPGQGDDTDGQVVTPVDEVVDEGQQARVGPLQVLEHQERRALSSDVLEERAPCGEELLGGRGRGPDAKERQQGAADPRPFRAIGHEALDRLGDARPRPGFVVVFEQAAASADHLAEGPEGDTRAVRGRSPVVPPDRLDQAVEVLLQLPRQPALADAALPADRDHAHTTFAAGVVEQLLEQPELGIATDERWLQPIVAPAATALGNDPQGPPQSHRRSLALECVLARWLEGDGTRSGLHRSLVDEDGAGRGRGLDAGSGVHKVARDHALPDGTERHGGVAGLHAHPGLQALVHGRDRIDELHGRPHGSLRVILMGDGRAPHGHDRVADELLDRAAVALDDLAAAVEVDTERLAYLLGIAPLGEGREANEVGEQHADQTSFGGALVSTVGRRRRPLGRRSRSQAQRRPALTAELGARRILRSAIRTAGNQAAATLDAEPPVGLVDGAASTAAHVDPPLGSVQGIG